MESTQDKTVYEVIAKMREVRLRRELECIEAIKQVHATQQHPEWFKNDRYSPSTLRRVNREPGAIARFSVNGTFKGWYRDGQRRGMPSKVMPIQRDLDAAYEAYYEMLRSVVPPQVLAAQLGMLSGQSRDEKGHRTKILTIHLLLLQEATLKHHYHAKLIAQKLNCNVECVRRVLRQINKISASNK